MNLYEETRFIMKQNNITANKNLGQNFLINEDVVDSIVENAEITKNDLAFQIQKSAIPKEEVAYGLVCDPTISTYNNINDYNDNVDIFDEDTRKALYREQKSSTTIRKEAKVYPNDPCPCGSGKKYKKCCGRNA